MLKKIFIFIFGFLTFFGITQAQVKLTIEHQTTSFDNDVATFMSYSLSYNNLFRYYDSSYSLGDVLGGFSYYTGNGVDLDSSLPSYSFIFYVNSLSGSTNGFNLFQTKNNLTYTNRWNRLVLDPQNLNVSFYVQKKNDEGNFLAQFGNNGIAIESSRSFVDNHIRAFSSVSPISGTVSQPWNQNYNFRELMVSDDSSMRFLSTQYNFDKSLFDGGYRGVLFANWGMGYSWANFLDDDYAASWNDLQFYSRPDMLPYLIDPSYSDFGGTPYPLYNGVMIIRPNHQVARAGTSPNYTILISKYPGDTRKLLVEVKGCRKSDLNLLMNDNICPTVRNGFLSYNSRVEGPTFGYYDNDKTNLLPFTSYSDSVPIDFDSSNSTPDWTIPAMLGYSQFQGFGGSQDIEMDSNFNLFWRGSYDDHFGIGQAYKYTRLFKYVFTISQGSNIPRITDVYLGGGLTQGVPNVNYWSGGGVTYSGYVVPGVMPYHWSGMSWAYDPSWSGFDYDYNYNNNPYNPNSGGFLHLNYCPYSGGFASMRLSNWLDIIEGTMFDIDLLGPFACIYAGYSNGLNSVQSGSQVGMAAYGLNTRLFEYNGGFTNSNTTNNRKQIFLLFDILLVGGLFFLIRKIL